MVDSAYLLYFFCLLSLSLSHIADVLSLTTVFFFDAHAVALPLSL